MSPNPARAFLPHSPLQGPGQSRLHPHQSRLSLPLRGGRWCSPQGCRGPEGLPRSSSERASRSVGGVRGRRSCSLLKPGGGPLCVPPSLFVSITCIIPSGGVRQLPIIRLVRLHTLGSVSHLPLPASFPLLQPLSSPCYCRRRPGPASEPQPWLFPLRGTLFLPPPPISKDYCLPASDLASNVTFSVKSTPTALLKTAHTHQLPLPCFLFFNLVVHITLQRTM